MKRDGRTQESSRKGIVISILADISHDMNSELDS